jgi:VanZ family protein
MPRARSIAFIPLLLIAVVALIVYGSLYPFRFKPDAIEGGLLEALRQLSWARAGRGDRISNVLLYLPLGFCLFLWLNSRLNRRSAVGVALLLGTLLSLVIEVAQVYVSVRVPSFTDLTLNALGTLMGAAMGFTWRVLSGFMHLPSRPEKREPDPGAALLIGLWLAWRWAPFTPQFDLVKLKSALQPLFNPEIEALAVFIYLTYWLIVSEAVSSLAGRQRSLEMLLLLIASVLVGRLIVTNQAFVPAELLALVLLVPMVVLTDRMTLAPKRWSLLTAIVIAVANHRLAPFDFSATAQGFDLWPFLGWFDSGVAAAIDSIDWVELFSLLFVLGALLWTIKICGASAAVAAAMVTAAALLLEIAQLWLPGRQPSITEPVLALGLGMVFRYLYRRAERRAWSQGPATSPRGRIL